MAYRVMADVDGKRIDCVLSSRRAALAALPVHWNFPDVDGQNPMAAINFADGGWQSVEWIAPSRAGLDASGVAEGSGESLRGEFLIPRALWEYDREHKPYVVEVFLPANFARREGLVSGWREVEPTLASMAYLARLREQGATNVGVQLGEMLDEPTQVIADFYLADLAPKVGLSDRDAPIPVSAYDADPLSDAEVSEVRREEPIMMFHFHASITEIGCYLDGHRGHYITRDMIELAIGYGYIVGSFERWALDTYDVRLTQSVAEYPHDALIELADEALAWLNNGQDDRIAGQNFPPIIPDGTSWGWNDGDFGLYRYDDEIID